MYVGRYTDESDNRYLQEGSDRDTDLDNVNRSGGHQALSVLSHVCKPCLHTSMLR